MLPLVFFRHPFFRVHQHMVRASTVLCIVRKLTGGKAWNKPWGVATPASRKSNRKAGHAVDAANRAALADAAARQPSQLSQPPASK